MPLRGCCENGEAWLPPGQRTMKEGCEPGSLSLGLKKGLVYWYATFNTAVPQKEEKHVFP